MAESSNTSASVQGKATVKRMAKLGVSALVIMNIVAVVSLRGLPAEATYGVSSHSITCLRR